MKQIVVVGGGIAGVSAAAALSARPGLHVTLIEAEANLAHHTTGRSAAQLIIDYGAPPVRALTRASVDALNPHCRDRAQLTVAGDGQETPLDELLASGAAAGLPIDEITVAEACAVAPFLRPDAFVRAALDRASADIDVAGLHQSFVQAIARHGGSIDRSRALLSAECSSQGWTIRTTTDTVDADVIVNAGGAWGDVVAERCGVAPVGLQPLRRTAFMVRSRFDDSAEWPLVADAVHSWYVKPDGAQFLCSPADEVPDEPRDAKPEEIDIAMAIDRINNVTTLDIRSVASSWAGLRTFGPDRAMVIGPDPSEPDFVWCVGQGGTGIQTAPAAGELVADLVVDGGAGSRLLEHGLELSGLLPDRLR